MNHFFAIELSADARQEVWATSQKWQRLLGPPFRVTWYAPEDYHVTLKFLGHVEEERQSDLITAAAPVAASTVPFVPGLESVGAFPDLHRPHVLWAGVSADSVLADLAARLDVALTNIGFAAERRPYRPHVTVARCRPTPEVGDWPAPYEHMFSEWWTTRLVLMQTLPPEQRANGTKARYNTVHTFSFGNTQLSDET